MRLSQLEEVRAAVCLQSRERKRIGFLYIFCYTGWPTVPFSETRRNAPWLRRTDALFIHLLSYPPPRDCLPERDISFLFAHPQISFRRIILLAAIDHAIFRFCFGTRNGLTSASIDHCRVIDRRALDIL